jgi:hypothetical protein
MDTVSKDAKQKKLRDNVEVAVEREMRQIEQTQCRERLPGEKESLKEKWIQGAQRIESSGKLAEVWNPKALPGSEGTIQGYFAGVNFDKEGRIIR